MTCRYDNELLETMRDRLAAAKKDEASLLPIYLNSILPIYLNSIRQLIDRVEEEFIKK